MIPRTVYLNVKSSNWNVEFSGVCRMTGLEQPKYPKKLLSTATEYTFEYYICRMDKEPSTHHRLSSPNHLPNTFANTSCTRLVKCPELYQRYVSSPAPHPYLPGSVRISG